MGINNFKEGLCYYSKIMKRKNFYVHPNNGQETITNVLQNKKDIVNEKKILPQINMDKTPLAFDFSTNRTVDEISAKTTSIFMMGYGRTSFTYVLICAANCDKLKLLIIFKKKTIPKGNFSNDIIICAKENGSIFKQLCVSGYKNLAEFQGIFFPNQKYY